MKQMNVVVPVDGSGLADRALPFAGAIARAAKARLTLVRATWSYPIQLVREPEQLSESTRHVSEEVAGSAGKIRRAYNVPTETHIGFGDPPHVIEQAAESRGATLIVMSTHGRSGLGRWFFGSVAETVLQHARVPVLIVPFACGPAWPTDRPLRILMPLDGSDLAEAAIEPITELAAAIRAELVLLRAVTGRLVHPNGVRLISVPPDFAITYHDSTDEELNTARGYLDDVAERLRARATVREIRAEPGSPADVIADVARAEKVDLIAMATHGRTGIQDVLLGSVARTTLLRSALPVLFVRPEAMRAPRHAPAEPMPGPVVISLSAEEVGFLRVGLKRLLSGDEPGDAVRDLLDRINRELEASPTTRSRV
jgi:nucleotide-binding universal stress UspA family protein